MRTLGFILLLFVAADNVFAKDDEAWFAAIDHYAITAPVSAARSVETLSAYLVKPFGSDEEKARSVFRWITENITYDVEGFYIKHKVDTNPGTILLSRKAACGGYSALFEALCKEAGLNVLTLTGYAKGAGYKPGDRLTDDASHAWNVVNIRGEWKFIDCTWGAGQVDDAHVYRKEFDSYHFFTKPEEFIYRHFPEDRRWQLLQRPISIEEFQYLPLLSPSYFQCGLAMKTNLNAVLTITGKYTLRFSAPYDVLCIASLESKGVKYAEATLLQRSELTYELQVNPPQSGEYVLNIYAKKKTEEEMFPLAASYRVIVRGNETSPEKFPLIFSTFMNKHAQLLSPLIRELPSGTEKVFSLNAPGTDKVAVVCGDTWDYLRKFNEHYEGSVVIDAGPVIVYAHYPGENNFQELLEFSGTGSSKRPPGPKKYKRFMDTDAEVILPLKRDLATGARQVFRVKFPGAGKVAIVTGSDWQFLERNGDYFEGTVDVGRGKIMVVASYNDPKNYEGLLEYAGQ